MNQTFKKIIKTNILLLVITALTVALLAGGVSYALFQTENKNEENQVISIGTLDADITSIDGAVEIRDIYPIKEEELGSTNKYSFSLVNTGDYDLSYSVYLKDNTSNVADKYDEYKVLDKELYEYMNYKLDGGIKANLKDIYESKTDKMLLFTGFLRKGETEEHYIQFWLDEMAPNDMIGTVLSLDIGFDGVVGESPSKNILETLKMEVNADTLDYTKTSKEEETNGLYSTEDDFGTSYYFRGNVDNNYVKFGKNKDDVDMYWRIIRINGDGSLRLIYDGTRAHANGEDSADRLITKNTMWNSVYNDNKFAGYTFTEENDRNSSNIKEVIDKWYEENILETGYAKYLANAPYCNDISTDNSGVYNVYTRVNEKNPSLKCSKDNSYMLGTNNKGNGYLNYPIGLISADEVILAGETNSRLSARNNEYYLYKGEDNWYWTMSPFSYENNTIKMFNSFLDGEVCDNKEEDTICDGMGIAPVINISAMTVQKLKGTGIVTFDNERNVMSDNAFYLDIE